MAKQTINVGSADLAGDGESIRNAFTKVNSNFTEVYTQVPLATTATYTQSFNTSTLVRAAVSATNIVNGTWTLALSTAGTVTFPNGLLKIAGNTISNLNVVGILSTGSQIQIGNSAGAGAGVLIKNAVTNTIGGEFSSTLESGSKIQMDNGNVSLISYTYTGIGGDTGLEGRLGVEVDNSYLNKVVRIGTRTITTLGGGNTTSSFQGITINQYGELTFPDASVQTTAWTEVKSEFNPYFRDANGTFAGTATITASYVLHGSLCHWHLQVDFPGTINYGNSQYQMTLPFPAHSTITTTNGTLHQVGGGGGSGADTRYAIAGQLSSDVSTTVMKFWYRSGTSDAMWKYNTPGGVPPGNPTGPAYWAVAGDAHFDISGTYQIA